MCRWEFQNLYCNNIDNNFDFVLSFQFQILKYFHLSSICALSYTLLTYRSLVLRHFSAYFVLIFTHRSSKCLDLASSFIRYLITSFITHQLIFAFFFWRHKRMSTKLTTSGLSSLHTSVFVVEFTHFKRVF